MSVFYFQCYWPSNFQREEDWVLFDLPLDWLLSRMNSNVDRQTDRHTQTDRHPCHFLSVQCHALHWTDHRNCCFLTYTYTKLRLRMRQTVKNQG